jgi:uncharacterized repeat protein (TIGR03803 family)
MKTSLKKNPFLVSMLIAGLSLMPAVRAAAQTFTTLHAFPGVANPGYGLSALVLSSGNYTLYGTAYSGGVWTNGMVYAVNIDGTGFSLLHVFSALTNQTNSDGANPDGGVILSGNTLYGTTQGGGNSPYGYGISNGANGTVFAVNTDGSGFKTLHLFDYNDGASPCGPVVLSGNTLYGTTIQGGASGWGSIFRINTDGTGFATVYTFTNGNDGYGPTNGLILSGSTLYGTAFAGFSSGSGTIFKLDTSGTNFQNIYTFPSENSAAQFPIAGIILSGSVIFGTTSVVDESFPSAGFGCIFAVNNTGSGFRTLYSFNDSFYGWEPQARLILAAGTFYGTASYGGTNGGGTVFAANMTGTDVKMLHTFSGTYDGAYPFAGLILSGNTLYGTTTGGAGPGGTGNRSTVFSLTVGTGEPQAPYISGQPTSQTVTAGDNAVFSVMAGGTPPLNYQWQFDSVNLTDGSGISGSTNSILTLGGAAQAQAGTYDVIISNSAGSISSDPALLVVNPGAPQLTILLSGTNILLTWPASPGDFALQSATNLLAPVIWTPVSSAPILVNGQNTVTVPVSGTQQFYELIP